MLPILLVMGNEPPPEVCAALAGSGHLFRTATPNDAARSVNDGWGELVICTRFPGWRAFAARVQTAGGAVILVGTAPDEVELRSMEPSLLEVCPAPEALDASIRQALERLRARRGTTLDEHDLKERALCAELVGRFAQSIALQIDLPHVVEEAIARTRDLCDADGASLLLVDAATGELTFDAVSGGAGDRIQQIRLRPGQGVAGKVARTAQPLIVEDVAKSPWFDGGCDAQTGFVTGSIIAVPLVLAGDLIGVLEAVRGSGRAAFTRAHLRRLTDLSPHVSIALYNAQITRRLREAQAQMLRDNAELEQRIAERTAQIVRAKREWESTFDAINEPIAVQDGFVLRRVNLAYARRAGLPITQVPGRTCHEVLAGRSTPCPNCPLASGSRELEGEIVGSDRAALRYSGFRLTPDGNDAAVVMHYQDVTRQRTLERRLRDSERLASLGQLASGAAHEINNPLGFLVSNLRNLREDIGDLGGALEAAQKAADALRAGRPADAARVLGPVASLPDDLVTDARDMIDESLEGARRVGEIVRGLRELSRQQLSREGDADVNASVTRTVRAEFGDARATLMLSLEADAPAAIDPLQLDQALGHIVRNAKQAVTGTQRVHVRTSVVDSEVLVEVRDEGCGIRPEHLSRVFEPFFTTRGVGGGIGLGLTAAWGIIQRYGGHIDVQSELGRGTSFTLRLPRAVTTHAPQLDA